MSRRLVGPAIATAFAGVLLTAACTTVSEAERSRCSALSGAAIENGRVVAAEISSAGFHPSWKTALIGVWGFNLPEACRVSVVLTPSPDSHIVSAIWLPTQTWNGRLVGTGNGGLGGAIDFVGMTSALQYNYVVAATDTGHAGADTDGAWALGHPERLRDFGWRSIHETALAAKALIAAFYGRPPRYSYFISGSNGGREALMEAQRFPEDYDGILAGAPAFDGANNVSTVSWMQQRLLQNTASYIPQSKLPAISRAVISACDSLDGVADGVLEYPPACHFEPAILQCAGQENDSCLTAAQIASLRAIYDGPGGALGDSRHWGFAPGGEAGWANWMLGSRPQTAMHYLYGLQFHRYLVYADPNWDMSHYSFENDRVETESHLRADYNARDPDLSRFMARGGKLILWHGWSDPALQPHLTIDYYEQVRALLGAGETDSFVRLYMAPGVEHVIGGPGPNVFGQIPAPGDPTHSMSAALQHWVEDGVAPQSIIASRYGNALAPLLTPTNARPTRTRPLCPYPQRAVWGGHGSTDDARNFACAPAETAN